MKARALRQAAIGLLVFTGAMPAVHAQNDPTIEACAKYAEADAAYEATVKEVSDVYNATLRGPQDAAAVAADEARAVYEAAHKAAGETAQAARGAAYQAAQAAYEAAEPGGGRHGARTAARQAAEAAQESAYKEARAALNAVTAAGSRKVQAALQKAEAARSAAIEDAQTVFTQTYLAIYAEDGGMQSDVWDVMVKLLDHQRNRCTKLYGL